MSAQRKMRFVCPDNQKYFYYCVCHHCQEEEDNLKQCSGCKLVYYCSVAHQKSDWKNHRDLCRLVNKLAKECEVPNILLFEDKEIEEWKLMLVLYLAHLEHRLSRPLRPDEEDLFYFAKVCNICFSANIKKNYQCESCKLAVYCSEEHKNKDLNFHNRWCSEIRKCFVLDMKEFTEKYQSESEVFYDIPFITKDNFPSDIRSYFNMYNSTHDCSVVSDCYTASLTLLHTIFSYSALSDLKSLTIHVVGAIKREEIFLDSVEMFFHCMPNLRELNLFLVGLDADGFKEVPLCDKCKSYTVTIKVHKCFYHEFLRSSDFRKPNIIVAFNHSFHGSDTWKSTLRGVLNLKDIFFVFTSYDREIAFRDYKQVKNLARKNILPYGNKIHFHVKHQLNPFRSLRPKRNFCDEFCGPVFYCNNYYSVLECRTQH